MKRSRRYYVLTWGTTAAITAILILAWIYLYFLHANYIEPGFIQQIDRKSVVPKDTIRYFGYSIVIIGLAGVGLRWWRRSSPILVKETMDAFGAYRKEGNPGEGAHMKSPMKGYKAVSKIVVKDILLTGGMGECEDFQQYFAHFLILWGFIGLFATTSLDSIVNKEGDVLPLLHPVRLIGNITGVVFMAGLTLAIARRALLDRVRTTSKLGDWTFLASLWGTGATGFLVEWYADVGDPFGTAWSYLTHLAFVALIIAAAPWTKFIHAFWRPTWILYSKLTTKRRP